MRVSMLLLSLLLISGCEFIQGAMAYCPEAQGALDLICNVSPVIPVGAAGGQVTDPSDPDCVILVSEDSVPIEYCAPQ